MATTVRDYIDKAKRVQSQIGNEIDDIARTYEDKILDLNREDQIFKRGIDIDGQLLGKYRNNLRGNTRGYPKEAGDPFNFFDTGALFSGFNLLSEGNLLLRAIHKAVMFAIVPFLYSSMFAIHSSMSL